jgi:chromosome partitioning protein
VLPLAIGLRTSIADAVTDRVPVWRVQKTAAREAGREMKAALAAIVKNMGGLKHGH